MDSKFKDKSKRHLVFKNRTWWRFCIILVGLIGVSFIFFPQGISSAPLPDWELVAESAISWETKFHDQISTWVSEIGRKGEQFEDWLDAKYETYPLGPGSRQWVVIIHHNNEELGYLIMEQISEEPLFSLIEYGRSDEAVLSKELQENPLFLMEDFFYHGILWAKTEDNCLVDLITMEKYEHVPLKWVDPYWNGHSVSTLLDAEYIRQNTGDPILFLSDALSVPKTISPAELQQTERYFYRASILPDVIGLYNVLSIHYWNELNSGVDCLFIGIEDEGIRFFSSAYLEELGTFEKID